MLCKLQNEICFNFSETHAFLVWKSSSMESYIAQFHVATMHIMQAHELHKFFAYNITIQLVATCLTQNLLASMTYTCMYY